VNAKGLITAAGSSAIVAPAGTLTGTLATSAEPAHTGAVTNSAGSLAMTITPTITAGGPIGSSTTVPVITFNAAGQLTAVSSATIAAGTGTVTSVATTGPITGGTITTSGTIACPTCATTTSGGALTGVSPIVVSSGGAISISGVAGTVLNGAGPSLTPTPTLGVAGSTLGSLSLANLTSGTVTLQPVTGALGSSVISFPAVTDTVVTLAATQTLSAKTLASPTVTGNLTVNAGNIVATGSGSENIEAVTTGAASQGTLQAFNTASGQLGLQIGSSVTGTAFAGISLWTGGSFTQSSINFTNGNVNIVQPMTASGLITLGSPATLTCGTGCASVTGNPQDFEVVPGTAQ
jgi:hypothetical protein